MLTFVGKINITTNSGTVQFGDTGNSTSITAEKRFFGAGAENAGNIIKIISVFNQTNTIEIEKESQLKAFSKRDCQGKKCRKQRRKEVPE